MTQRVGRGIALLFHDRGTRRGWVVSSTLRPHFTPGKDAVPILEEDGWAPGPVWKGWKSRPHRDSIPNRPARSQSLYRLSYPAHMGDILVTDFTRRTNSKCLINTSLFFYQKAWRPKIITLLSKGQWTLERTEQNSVQNITKILF